MTRRVAGRASASVALASGALLFLLFASPTAGAQDDPSCIDFGSQEEAQEFYNDHSDDDPNDPDPYDLDTDQDGTACEGIPTAAAQTSPSPGATPTASPGSNSLPRNGAETGVIALSGLSLLEAGYGLTLASKRLGIRRRSIPLYLMRRMVSAAERGGDRIEIADDVYLVHRSALESRPVDESSLEITDERSLFEPQRPLLDDEDDLDDDLDMDAEFVEIELAEEEFEPNEIEAETEIEPELDRPILGPEVEEPAPSPTRAPSVYAALAKPGALPLHDKR